MGIKIFSKKNYAKFYVIASAVPLLFIFDFFVVRSFGISFLNTEIIHLKVASFIQMLLLTYAIIYRMKEIKEENELRLTEMRIFMKRKEILNRESVERLMQDVYLENLIMHYDLDGLEIKLLQYISEGKPNEKIARKLKMTEIDVEELTKELYDKLEVSEQIQEDHRMLEDQPDYIYN
jgi:DNA-binding CsgD family transcriptional regulator